jgi:NAD(P)-dependent dehydrogenase (short-subunit alcohol dehydrogenase family)
VSGRPSVVLTGGSAGIGLAILQALSDCASVIVISRTPPPPADLKEGLWIPGDLQHAEKIADDITSHFQSRGEPLVGLIHCAGSYGANQRHGFLDTTRSEWEELMAVNVTGQFILTHRLLPLLLAGHQSFIIAISSNTATEPAPGRIAYGCSKAASHALFSGLAAEYADSALSIVQVLPDRQVVTRGLKRRRPAGFDMSSYIRPEVFQEPIRNIVLSRGEGRNGQSIVLH